MIDFIENWQPVDLQSHDKPTPQQLPTVDRSLHLPVWLICLPAEWQSLMGKLNIEFDVNLERYNWTGPLWGARLVIHLMVQKRKTKNKPAVPKAFNDLFFKIGRNGEPMTEKQLTDALKSKANNFRGKSDSQLYKRINSAVDEVFWPVPYKTDITLR